MPTNSSSARIDFLTAAPVPGSMPERWNGGTPPRAGKRVAETAIQVHHFDEHTVVLRQSKSVSFEGPFIFLLFGNDRALLLDTGATTDPARFPLRETIDRLIADWLTEHPRAAYELVVAHTHAHADHVAGDAQFAGRANTVLVPKHLDAVTTYFGFTQWPAQIVDFDLGGRILEVTGSPGHHETAISIYDPWTGSLLTGDSVYPGRLYVHDMPAFIASLSRLVELAQARSARRVLGCHIEMSRRPGRDYPAGSTYQPEEPPLQMNVEQLRRVHAAALSISDSRGAHVFDDFIIFNGPSPGAMARHVIRGLSTRLRNRLPVKLGGA